MRYAEDFPVGHRYITAPYAMTANEIVEVAQKYDPQYFHLDAEAARNSHFGGLVSAGVQTIALCWKLAHETGLFDDVVLAGIGFDHVRWLKPVRVDDVVHVELFLLEMTPSKSKPERAVARFQYEMKNQHDETVLTLQMLQIVRRRPHTDPA
jgi:acyl dehydratase